MGFSIKLNTNEEAFALRNAMYAMVVETGSVKPSDVYKMLDLNVPYSKADENCYWDLRDICSIQIRELTEGWGLYLPSPQPISEKKFENSKKFKENSKLPQNGNDDYESNDDMVSHPPHYQSESGLEVIDVIKAFTEGLTGIVATDTGNIIKYACRWHKKNGVQDLEKILWYTQHLINELKTNREAFLRWATEENCGDGSVGSEENAAALIVEE